MGMYDSVIFKCPECRGEIEVQSKAGPCTLRELLPTEVPPKIAADIIGETGSCPHCGHGYRLNGHAIVWIES